MIGVIRDDDDDYDEIVYALVIALMTVEADG